MPILKRKKSDGSYEIVTSQFPTDLSYNIEKVDPNFKVENIVRNGTYEPQEPYNGFSHIVANIKARPDEPVSEGNIPFLISASGGGNSLNTSTLSPTGVYIDIPITGTYTFLWSMYESNESTARSQLYKNGEAIGTQQSVSDQLKNCTCTQFCEAEDRVEIYNRSTSKSSWISGGVSQLVACINWEVTP